MMPEKNYGNPFAVKIMRIYFSLTGCILLKQYICFSIISIIYIIFQIIYPVFFLMVQKRILLNYLINIHNNLITAGTFLIRQKESFEIKLIQCIIIPYTLYI